jgi:ArsR family transcriptional regulator, arsenate/arsenite/antimonite-responsive transcriptional repressor
MKRNKAESYQMELLFRALADRTRLRLLNLMGDDEVCVCFLVEALKLTQPKISRHLAYLRRAGIVASRRDGKWMHYRLNEPSDSDAAGVLRAVRDSLVNDPAMQSDRGRLLRLCCSSTLPASLKKAPKPPSIVTAH